MNCINCYNALVVLKENSLENNDINFLDGILNYFDNINKVFDVCEVIEKVTHKDIDTCLLSSFKSNKLFDENNKFDIIKLKFDDVEKIYKILKKKLKEEFKDKVNITLENDIIILYIL